MNTKSNSILKPMLSVAAFIGCTLVGLLVFYGSIYLLTDVLPVSKLLFETRASIVPLVFELLILVVIIFFVVRINTYEKKSRKTLFEDFSRENLQRFIIVEIVVGILAGLFLMMMYFMIYF